MSEEKHLSETSDLLPSYQLISVCINSMQGLSEDPSYIVKICSFRRSENEYLIASASSDFTIKLYIFDTRTGQVCFHAQLKGHKDTIRGLEFVGNTSRLLTAAEDGVMALWDTTTLALIRTFPDRPTKSMSSCSSNGQLLAAGSQDQVLLWSLDNPKKLIKLSDYHSEEIVETHFHPYNINTLFSSGEDGIINQYDLKEGFDHEDAVESVFPIEQPVTKFGFFGPAGEYMYAVTSIETLSLWNVAKAELIADFKDIRNYLTNLIKAQVDYLVDCHYDSATQRLYLLAGDHQGLLFMFHVNRRELQLAQTLTNGHNGVVRDALWLPSCIITAGEDSKFCIWSCDSQLKQLSQIQNLETSSISITPALSSSSATTTTTANNTLSATTATTTTTTTTMQEDDNADDSSSQNSGYGRSDEKSSKDRKKKRFDPLKKR